MRGAGRLGRWLPLVLLAAAGCSTGSNSFALFPEGHRLIPAARAVRSSYNETLLLPRELDKHPAPPYTVEPGDVLLVQPASLDSPARLPGDQQVLSDGTINLGRYGLLPVAGLTIDQIAGAVRPLVEAQTKDAGPITVRLMGHQSKVFYVLGEVNAPGSFPLTGRETVLDAIVAAGGLNDRASRKNIILARPTKPGECRVVLPVCYREIVQLGDTTTNYQLAAGDRIYVPTRGWDDCKKDKGCGPCGGPQTACPIPPAHAPPAVPAPTPASDVLHPPRPYPAYLDP
jgi:protein involved in polysaccharide export with SLBB domain